MNARRRYKAKRRRRVNRLVQMLDCRPAPAVAYQIRRRLLRAFQATLILVLMIAPAHAQSARPTPAEAVRRLRQASPDLEARPAFYGLILPRVSAVPKSPTPPRNPFPRPTMPPKEPWVPWIHVGQSFTPVIDVRIVGGKVER